MTSSRAFAALLVALALITTPTRVGAQTRLPSAQELETARTLYKEGKDLRAAGDLRGALEKLQAAHALGQTPVTGIELARTYVMASRLVEAREVALSIARLGVASDETEKSMVARAEGAKLADELRPRIPALTVRMSGLAPGEVAHLTIDGVPVPDAALSETQRVDPGKHVLVLRVGEGAAAREARAQTELVEGQAVEVVIPAPPAPAAAPPPTGGRELPVREQPHGMPLLARVGFGVAIAGTAVGLYAGVSALDKKDQLGGECSAAKACGTNNSGAGDLDAAHAWANVSTVSFILAGAALATGIVVVVLDRPHAPPPSGLRVLPLLGLGFAGIHGDF